MSFFFFKQKTAYEMRISEWSSDVCSSDLGNRTDQLPAPAYRVPHPPRPRSGRELLRHRVRLRSEYRSGHSVHSRTALGRCEPTKPRQDPFAIHPETPWSCRAATPEPSPDRPAIRAQDRLRNPHPAGCPRSEERRVGNEGVRTYRYRGCPIYKKKK